VNATKERWITLCKRIGVDDNPNNQLTVWRDWDELRIAYTGSDRHYHNLGHISDGLKELDEIRHLTKNPDTLEFAWWWHDFIYKTTQNHNNEGDSSIHAVKSLSQLLSCNHSLTASLIPKVIRFILATKHDCVPQSADSRLMIDIDLSSLGTLPAIFNINTANIRKEYSHVSDDDFAKGRIEFFKKFLESRPSIYLTEYFKNKYEAQAQENLGRLLTTR